MSKIQWRQERLAAYALAKRLTELNIHPGYFQVINDGKMIELIYLVLEDSN